MKTSQLTSLLITSLMLLSYCKPEELIKVTKLQTGEITEITATSAKANGTFVDLSGNVTEFGHCWNISGAPTIDGPKYTVSGTAQKVPITSFLTNLTENSTYHVRAFAIDNGTPVYGDDVSFITKEYGLPGLSTTDITAITHISASSGGTISTDGGSSVTSKGVCWSTLENPTIALTTKTNDGTGTGSFTSNITGLTPNTSYFVRAYATTSKGTSYGDQKPFTTKQEPSISVTSPVNTDHWVGGEQHLISWSFTNVTGNVTISLYSGLTFQTNLFTGISINTGQQEWIVPNGTAYGKDYKIRVTSTSDANTFGESQVFTLSEINGTTGTVSDVNTNLYNTIKIGKQWWMAKNLKASSYSDLSSIPMGSTVVNICSDKTLRYFFAYNNYDDNSNTYGRLYTWAAAMKGLTGSELNPSGVQGVCPAEWHIPSDAEWKQMEAYIGMANDQIDLTGFRGTIEATKLKKDTTLWSGNYPETNTTGFSAIPGGFRNCDGNFYSITLYAYFWSSSSSGDMAYIRRMLNSSQQISRITIDKAYAASIRCIKD